MQAAIQEEVSKGKQTEVMLELRNQQIIVREYLEKLLSTYRIV